ncbi:MAG: hypothetical protein JWQ09_4154 [Segetibacter sp.]|nr:hypothetical protein [Segetibacter sp.]
MDNNNPSEMTNEDLEKDMQQKNQENLNKSTAAEGTIKEIDEDEATRISMHTAYKGDEEQDMDDLVHEQAAEEEDSQDGSIPDPEEVANWENNEDDLNKFSG